jgi:hypothetical protein
LLDRGKILILLQLGGGGLPCGVQNLDSMGLAAKIFRNKDLDTSAGLFSGKEELVPDCFGSVRTIPLWAFHSLGQGCTSHESSIFLWMAVEK